MYLLLVFLLAAAVHPQEIAKYANSDIRYDKCCPPGQYLHYEAENSTLACYEDSTITLQINTRWIENYTENCNEKCADFFVNSTSNSVKLIIPNCDAEVYSEITNFTAYPKCCPLGHLYNPQEHSCVRNTTTTFPQQPGIFIATTLSQCKGRVLVDHYMDHVQVDAALNVRFNGASFAYGNYCFDDTVNGRKVVRTCEEYARACKRSFDDAGVRCFKKCCPDGHIYVGRSCKVVPGYGLSVLNQSRIKANDDYNFGVIQAPYRRKYMALEKHVFFIDAVGNLHIRKMNRWVIYNSDEAIYCMETYNTGNHTSGEFFIFSLEDVAKERMKFNLNAIALSISCVFAIATVICYLILPEMHNLYGKSIMMYCLVLSLGFSILAYVQFEQKGLRVSICTNIAFLLQFSFLAGFSWLNVICFDMWMAFGQLRVKGISTKKTEMKRFIYYNIYAWSVPTIITLLTYIVYRTKCLPDYLVPRLGNGKCFFDRIYDTYDYFLFFLGPFTILIVANVVFFTKTIMYCFKVKNQINKMKASPSNDKDRRSQKLNADMEKFMMLLKLCLIMGVSWLFEIVSSLIDFKANKTTEMIEFVWDIFNSLQGLFIFCIFILKRPMLVSLRNKLTSSSSTKRAENEMSTAMTSVSANERKYKVSQNGNKTTENTISAA